MAGGIVRRAKDVAFHLIGATVRRAWRKLRQYRAPIECLPSATFGFRYDVFTARTDQKFFKIANFPECNQDNKEEVLWYFRSLVLWKCGTLVLGTCIPTTSAGDGDTAELAAGG